MLCIIFFLRKSFRFEVLSSRREERKEDAIKNTVTVICTYATKKCVPIIYFYPYPVTLSPTN